MIVPEKKSNVHERCAITLDNFHNFGSTRRIFFEIVFNERRKSYMEIVWIEITTFFKLLNDAFQSYYDLFQVI